MQNGLVEHVRELLSSLGSVRSRRMFGGHGLYADDVFVALIASDRLYLKVDDTTRPRFEAAGCEPFVYDRGGSVTLGYWSVPPEAMESPALMQPWARLALEAALRARATKPVKPGGARSPKPPRQAAAAAPSQPRGRSSKPSAARKPPR